MLWIEGFCTSIVHSVVLTLFFFFFSSWDVPFTRLSKRAWTGYCRA
jgi:hypothetical protein